MNFKRDEKGNVVPNPYSWIDAERYGVDFKCKWGQWRENVKEGDYTVWPNLGLSVSNGGCTELIRNAMIGPPLGKGKDGKTILLCVDNDEWKNKKIKGIFIVDNKQSLAVN